jgi:hypothetical protein
VLADVRPRGFALSRLVRLACAIGPPFLSERSGKELARVPDVFGESLSWCGLECRFDDEDRVDLMVCVERADNCILLERLGCEPWTEDWASEATWLRGWGRGPGPGTPYVWFEFDLSPGGGAVPILLFVPFEVEIGRPPPGNNLEAVVTEAHLLSGFGFSPGGERALRRVIAALPPGGWPLHLASLRHRAIEGCRLVVSVPTAAAASYAAEIGWPGSRQRLAGEVRRVAAFTSHVNLSFDVTDSVGARLGIDCFFPSSPGRDPRWKPVLEILEEGGARPDRLEAFRSWYGQANTPHGPVFRNPFVKLVIDGDHPTSGKAYLAFQPAPENPGVSTSAIPSGSPTPR